MRLSRRDLSSRLLAGIALSAGLTACNAAAPQGERRSGPAPQAQRDQIIDLMFPASSPWAELPVAKWDHKPRGLVILEGDLSDAESDGVKSVVHLIEKNAPVADVQFAEVHASSDLVTATAMAFDFTIVFGHHAITESRTAYRWLLRSVLPDNGDPNSVVDDALSRHQPAFSKYRFDLSTGRLTKFVTFADANGDPHQAIAVTGMAIVSSLSPSIVYSRDRPRLFMQTQTRFEFTPLAYTYLNYLYSDRVPMGSHLDDVRKAFADE